MTSDYQTSRAALAARLRELRTDARLNGKQLAETLGWHPSKVSRLENGQQDPSRSDLEAWSAGTDPRARDELTARLQNMQLHYATWKRQLRAGTRVRQDYSRELESTVSSIRAFEVACIPGLLHTPDYARAMFERTSTLHLTPGDYDESVRSRMARQQILYDPGQRNLYFLIWEPALLNLIASPEVMGAQLDRLTSVIGLPRVSFRILPLSRHVDVVPSHGFWIFNDDLVLVETVAGELRIDDASELSTYRAVWDRLSDRAVDGGDAHRLLRGARERIR